MIDTERVISVHQVSTTKGRVVWSPTKSLWFLFHLTVAFAIAPLYLSFSSVLVFIVLTAVTLCFGHSLGMHRLLIHRSYECPKWMEYLFVYLGVLVSMAGPYSMIWQHDLRDWAQRQKQCHEYLRHGSSLLKDGWWQLNCDLKLEHAPTFILEPQISNDKFYQWLEKTWLLQQFVLAIPLYYFGGISWLAWGISMRIAVSLGGHWLIGYFAHNTGQRTWRVKGAAVQGHNIRIAGWLSMGEAWHNNHHAYPGSAMLGLYEDEADPGWWVLNALKNLGLVSNIKLPAHLPQRKELVAEGHHIACRTQRKPEECEFINYCKRL